MKTSPYETTLGMTLVELIIVIGSLAVLAAILLPNISRQKTRSSRINCVNNQKQIGLAFRTWATGSIDAYPMQVSVEQGGTKEVIDSAAAFRHFLVLSNELSTPKILVCPTDTGRVAATTFARTPMSPSQIPFGSRNLSYLLGVDSSEVQPQQLLCADDNFLIDGKPIARGLNVLADNSKVTWSTARHQSQGNVALADGSVQQLSNSRLGTLMLLPENITNRLVAP